MSLITPQAEILRLQNLCCIKRENQVEDDPSYRLKFGTKFIAKLLVLSDKDKITSGPLIIVSTDDFPLLRILIKCMKHEVVIFFHVSDFHIEIMYRVCLYMIMCHGL